MSKQYTNAVSTYYTKKQSRENVANGIKESMMNNSVIHYLGGTSTQTPFENKFKSNDVTFVRYERMKSILPSGYSQVSFNRKGNAILPRNIDKGYFCNGDFFDCFFPMNEKVKGNESHFWLDFCGMPKSDLLESIYHTFFSEDSNVDFKSIYITFFLNPRSCKDVKENLFVNNEKTTEEKAQTLLNKFKTMVEKKDIDCGIFEIYNNGSSPMCVLKIERREQIEDMSKKASVENYVNLHKRGFTNKQIAIFWKAGIMQVAGFAASAKRQKMI